MGPLARVGSLIAATTLLGLVQPGTAGAVGASFSITPTTSQPYFIFNSKPGALIRGQVKVVNVSSVAGEAKLYPVDATTGQTSGAVYQSETAPRRGVGSWIKLASSSLRLGPHQGAQVSFTVRVPAGRLAGQYLGGLVAAPTKPMATKSSKRGRHTFHVNIQEIAVVAVQVNLPGALARKLAITGVRASGRPGYQTLLVSLSNKGNALLKGHGKITVSRAGKRVFARSFALDTMVPQTKIDFPLYVQGARLPPGHYVSEVTIFYTGGHVVHAVFGFTISTKQVRQTFGSNVPGNASATLAKSSSVPIWAIVLGALALVAASIGLSALFFRRRTREREA